MPQGFVHVPITQTMLDSAQSKDAEMGALRGSIREGDGNLVGFLGEEVFLAAFGQFGARSNNDYNHDVSWDGLRWEIKSKDRTVPPRWSFDASIASFNARQEADLYVFVSIYRPAVRGSVTKNYTDGYVVGCIAPKQYKQEAVFHQKGDYFPGENRVLVKHSCYNLPYSKLTTFRSFFEDE